MYMRYTTGGGNTIVIVGGISGLEVGLTFISKLLGLVINCIVALLMGIHGTTAEAVYTPTT